MESDVEVDAEINIPAAMISWSLLGEVLRGTDEEVRIVDDCACVVYSDSTLFSGRRLQGAVHRFFRLPRDLEEKHEV